MGADAISKALNDFARMPLREGAVRLLGELGLESDRTLDTHLLKTDDSVDGFLHQFPDFEKKLSDNQRSLFERLIRNIFVLFQVTEEEINLLASPAECKKVSAHSLLFVIADMHACPHLTQGELGRIARALNKGLAPAVIGLFRYNGSLALGTAPKRKHKRDPGLDAFRSVFGPGAGVKMGISLSHPAPDHLDFLLEWKRIIRSSHRKNMGDVVMHLANVPDEVRMRYISRYQ